MNTFLKKLSPYKIWILCIATVIAVPFFKPAFSSSNNIESLLRSMTTYGVTALGLTVALITGEINVAVGSIVAFSSVIFAKYTESIGLFPAVLITVSSCLILGFMNGYLVAYKKLPALLISIAFQISVRGLALWASDSQPIKIYNESFIAFARMTLGPVPVIFLILLAFVLVIEFILRHTCVGRNLFACAGKADVAKAAGINVNLYKMGALAFSYLMAAFGGIIITARLFSASPSVGEDAVMTIMPIIVMGGTSLSGGKGGAICSLSGAIIMYLIFNVMSLFNVPVNAQDIVKGTILLTIVCVDKYFINKDKKV